MVRPFGLRDAILIHKLQDREVQLDWPEALIRPRSALSLALKGYLFQRGAGTLTYVLDSAGRDGVSPFVHEGLTRRSVRPSPDEDGGELQGFLQTRLRAGRPEWDIISLAPSPESEEGMAACEQLLRHVCQTAGDHGVLRLFAKARGAQVEAAFRKLDFTVYAYEDVFRREAGDAGLGGVRPLLRARSRQPEDEWGLHRLYLEVTPSSVQLAEGLAPGAGQPFTLGASGIGEDEYVVEEKGNILGYLGLATGREGHVMHLVVHPDYAAWGSDLLAWGASMLGKHSPRPIYCRVRQYEGDLRPWLQEHGFEPIAQQALLVKHLTVRLMEPALKRVPGLEKRAGAAPTHGCEGIGPGGF